MDNSGHPKVLLAVLLLISAFSIVGERVPETFREFLLGPLPALVLLGLHALLHLRRPGSTVLYHGVQSALVAAIGVVSGSVSPVITLTAWMCGETVAVEESPRIRAVGTTWHAAVGLFVIVLVAGAESALQWVVAAVPTIAFVIVVILLYARESRARQSAQELARELADSNRRIAEYAEEAAFRSREQERQRMARDLHDTLAQGLTGVILQIRAAGAHLDGGNSDAARAVLADSLEQAQEALAEARRAIQDLREADAWSDAARGSGEAGAGGLPAFLHALCDDLSRRYNRPVGLSAVTLSAGTMTGADRELSLPGPTLFELTNIVGEAVHNAVRHGECRSVAVRLRDAHGALELEIADDGSGFDVDQVPKRGHYGIRGMRERAKTFGGELSVRSTPGSGTTVSVTIPLPTANGKEEPGG